MNDRIPTAVDLEKLADLYLRHHRTRNDEDFWAWEEVRRIVGTDLNAGWRITLLLLEKAAADDEVGYIAAGPLEDLIDVHGHKALDLIEPECENNVRLRLALSTAGVLFYYEEFDRWYALLCKYGFKQTPSHNSRAVIEEVMYLMKRYLDEAIGVGYYGRGMEDFLDSEPLDDKKAQRILQGAYCDFERLDNLSPPDRRSPEHLREIELRARLIQSLAELESLGYRANSNTGQDGKI